ncbi:ABC transporter permease [Desulfogranum mediterraneum]|uniref:ABC transporter permease n=1 Tax=Desulfogranum mediterraneum TaxID=160661 RepID=UPI00041C2F8B|nr:ABC transporter permease [Desulfogranum mediterraneum]
MIRTIHSFLALLWHQRRLIFSMASREVKTQYVGSSLGFLWTIIQPVVMITVFWFVFSIGFKARPMNDVPFVVWLTAGLAPWYFFADIISGSTGLVVGHAHLVKKTIFHPHILPIVKVLSALVSHLVFLGVLFVLIISQQQPFLFSFLQVMYYGICLVVLALGTAWVTSALNVFVRDISHLVGVVLQVGFWVTPIFWDISMMPAKVQGYLKLNPVFYIIQGYRDSFITGAAFWNYPQYTLYFWGVALANLLLGAMVFKRLKPQFSDVL